MVLINITAPLTFSSEYFSLKVSPTKGKVLIEMQTLQSFVNTKNYPLTYLIIQRNLPSVLRTKCYNEKHLSFYEEIKATELGHLFEHILLEYLCLQKSVVCKQSAVFNGRTKWNWIKNPYGSFEITVDAGLSEVYSLVLALKKTISLMLKIVADQPSSATKLATNSRKKNANRNLHPFANALS